MSENTDYQDLWKIFHDRDEKWKRGEERKEDRGGEGRVVETASCRGTMRAGFWWRRKAQGDSQKIIYGSDKKRRVAPLSKSHASPFTHGLAVPIFRNINSMALRTPFASRQNRYFLRGLSETRSLNNRLRRGTALSPSPLRSFFIFFSFFFLFLFHFLAL